MLTVRKNFHFLCVCGTKKRIEATVKYIKSRKQEKRFYIHPLNAARKLDHSVNQSLACTTPHAFVSYLSLFRYHHG